MSNLLIIGGSDANISVAFYEKLF